MLRYNNLHCFSSTFLFFLSFFQSITLTAQQIRVLDKKNGSPLEQIFLYNKGQTETSLSDTLGVIDISKFSKRDTLVFTHPSYQTLTIPKLNVGNIVYLSQKTVSMEQVNIIAEEEKSDALEAISKIDKIEQKQVQFNNPQTSAELLELSGGVFIQKSQSGGGSPIIRGFEANRVLLVIDGVRMNNAIYRNGHLQNAITIDHSIIESTDIIYGPNSVIYGSDAIGGVVHYRSKRPQFMGDNDSIGNNSASAYTRYSSANKERTFHLDFNLGSRKLASLTSATFTIFDNLTMGQVKNDDYPEFGIVKEYVERIDDMDSVVRKEDFSEQINTGYFQMDFLQKFSFKASENLLFTLNTHYSTSSDINRYDQLTDFTNGDNLRWAEWYYGPQNRALASFSTKIKSTTNWFTRMEILTHYQKIDEDRITRRVDSDIRTTREEDVNVFGINIDFVKENTNTSKWFYGIEAIHNRVSSKASSTDIKTLEESIASTRYPDGGSTLTSYSLYLTFKNKFTEKLTYSVGGRYNLSQLTANFTDTTFFTLPFSNIVNTNGALTANAGLVFHPNEAWNFQIAVSTGYRSPNVDDIGKVFAKDDYVIVPNNELKPEHAYNGELGITRTFNNAFTMNINGFYTLLRNAIVRDFHSLNGVDSMLYEGELLRIQTNVNANEALVYGTSLNLKAKLSKEFIVTSSFNYTFGRNTTLDVPLAHIPPLYGRTDLVVYSHPLTMSVYMKYNAWKWISDYSPFGEDNEDKATKDGTPAWHTFNIRAQMQLGQSFSVQIALENMLDVHYRPFSSGISGAGRNFVFTLRADI